MTETGPSVTQPKQPRPLSPHLQVYKPQLTSTLSILHRATGIFLTLGLALFAWWIIALAMGLGAFEQVQEFSSSLVGSLLLIGWIWALFFHLFTGIRHLFWDAGYGFSIKATYFSGWTVIIGSILATILIVAIGVGYGLMNGDECSHNGC